MELGHSIGGLLLAMAAVAVPFWMWLRMAEDVRQHAEEKAREEAIKQAARAAEEAARAQAAAAQAAIQEQAKKRPVGAR